MRATDRLSRLASSHAADAVHATEAVRSTEATHSTARERRAVNARPDPNTEAVIQLMEMIEMIEMVKVMKAIDEDEAHTRADEKRRPPPPRVGIRVRRDRVPQ